MPTNLKVLGTQRVAHPFSNPQGGYPPVPPKFSTGLANEKVRFTGNKLESPWYTND